MMYSEETIDQQLDSATQISFCSFHANLPVKGEDTLRLFSRNSGSDAFFYTAHGDDALFVASQVFHTNSVIKCLGSQKFTPSVAFGMDSFAGLPSVTLRPVVAHSLLRDCLTVRQMKVEIWEAEGSKKSAVKFSLARQVNGIINYVKGRHITSHIGISRQSPTNRRLTIHL
jgi:DNA mismatch repair protein MSH2